jgi:NAD(P)-dependent dehydrogenase (short-subunit alcohol dehydrogenase family)
MNSPVVLITGALAGIGRSTALAFAREGARLVVSGPREDAGQVAAALARFGRLDVAVNNAGTEGETGPITEVTAKNYTAVFDTNVLGVLLSMKHELRVMQPQGSGSIINLSSTVGHRGAPNVPVYVASKHAVEGLTKAAALEAAPFGVRVNAVAPGPIDTDMLARLTGSAERKAGFVAGVPFKRAGKPDEIADAIVFLASEKASFITGQIVDVNGGKTAS